jgi:VWFA-related protein
MRLWRSLLCPVISSTLQLALAAPLLLTIAAWSQARNPLASTEPTTVIRSTTRLVQISISVTDHKGQPVTGLTSTDFTVRDEGVPQKIAFFSAPLAALPSSPTVLPPGTFTNRPELQGEAHGAVSVILFDALNTVGQDQSHLRKQVLTFLQKMRPQDRVALYALTMKLNLLHDFTQDPRALSAALIGYNPAELTMHDASDRAQEQPPEFAADPRNWAHLSEAITTGDARTAELALGTRILITATAFQKIAERLGTIPGRKNLVWISGGFPVDLTDEYPKSIRDPRNRQLVNAIINSFNQANTVIYPIDTHGLLLNPGTGADARGPAPLTAALSDPLFIRESTRATFVKLADHTGGRAFYGTNGVQEALTSAFNDGRFAYTIGYYPAHGHWDGKYRKLTVSVKKTDGHLRYRQGYFAALDESRTHEEDIEAAVHSAELSPLDASGLGMIMTAKPMQLEPEPVIELRIRVDPSELLLQESQRHRTGSVEVFYLQRDSTGETISAQEQPIDLNFEEAQYEHLVKTGIVFVRHFALDPNTTELRTVLWDRNSDATGSITLPITALLNKESGSK